MHLTEFNTLRACDAAEARETLGASRRILQSSPPMPVSAVGAARAALSTVSTSESRTTTASFSKPRVSADH